MLAISEARKALAESARLLRNAERRERRDRNAKRVRMTNETRRVVRAIVNLCPDTTLPAAAFLLHSQPHLVDGTSSQPPIDQMSALVAAALASQTRRHGNSRSQTEGSARSASRACAFLCGMRLSRWVRMRNDVNDSRR